MHLTTERLLARLSGSAELGDTAHLAGCERCRCELERLEALEDALVELPEIGPVRDLWPEIGEAVDRNRGRRRRRWLSAAAAAVLVAAAGLVAQRLGTTSREATRTAADDAGRRAVHELVSASRDLEALLERPSLRERVMGPRQAALIVALEDRIAGVDAVLAAAEEPRPEAAEVALWSERVRLLAALVHVRGAPASSPELQHAVLDRSLDL